MHTVSHAYYMYAIIKQSLNFRMIVCDVMQHEHN